jgi:Family of unknown function (DUF6174)
VRLRLSTALLAPALLLPACGGPTAPSVVEIEQAQARWATHRLTRYVYDFETSGFFNTLDGKTIHLVIIADTVRSAVFAATGDPVPVPAATLATVDTLFARALAARDAGALMSAEFDPQLGYPTRLQISGPPDASGAILASNLQLAP